MFNIYVITCLVNSKKYVGFTKNPIEKRWDTHVRHSKYDNKTGMKITRAIRKYGPSSFSIKLVSSFDDRALALAEEVKLIKELDTINSGYNILIGGEPGNFKPGPRPQIMGEKNPFFGKKHSAESRAMIGHRDYSAQSGKNHYMYGKRSKTAFKSGALHPLALRVAINGIEYGSINEAARAIGVHSCILKRRHLILKKTDQRSIEFSSLGRTFNLSLISSNEAGQKFHASTPTSNC